MIRAAQDLLSRLRTIQAAIRDQVVRASEQATIEQLATVASEQEEDTIFAIDRISEEVLLRHFEQLGEQWSFVLIAEGLENDGTTIFPRGMAAEDAELRIIIDPIDGTRGLMYQKRPAWILTGVAPNRGPQTNLHDIEIALQTEIPLLKQHLSDSFWAIAGQGVRGERFNRLSGKGQPISPHPSRARTIAYGYGNIARFFPGVRTELAAIDDTVVERLLGPVQRGKAQAFEDQYISTGGQLYELLMGHDRWIADLRPLVATKGSAGLNCHPYDLCTELVAREAGIIVTDEHGAYLSAPLDVTTGIAWMGYANSVLHQQVAPILTDVLVEHGLLHQVPAIQVKGE
jgi:fructose-1,6-bisphosphatase/inositol monophosphatase family enzyme